MTLALILFACLVAGNGSVWLANILLRSGLPLAPTQGAWRDKWLGVSAGALLATALLHLLPEALEYKATAHGVASAMLLGVVFAFVLERAELWHHGHEHHEHHERHNPQEQSSSIAGSWPILFGDALHSTADGVLIAAAFLTDRTVGMLVALAILTHEVPHHIGDLVVVGEHLKRSAAFGKVFAAGSFTAVGGLLAWCLSERVSMLLPFFLAFAASNFIYVALADLVPQLQRHSSRNKTLGQVGCLLGGVAVVALVTGVTHAR